MINYQQFQMFFAKYIYIVMYKLYRSSPMFHFLWFLQQNILRTCIIINWGKLLIKILLHGSRSNILWLTMYGIDYTDKQGIDIWNDVYFLQMCVFREISNLKTVLIKHVRFSNYLQKLISKKHFITPNTTKKCFSSLSKYLRYSNTIISLLLPFF